MKWSRRLYRLALLSPFFGWIYLILTGNLGAEPAKELNHQTGLTAFILLNFNLWLGILVPFLKPWPQRLRFLLLERRFLGVWTFVILVFHVTFYLILEAFQAQAFWQIIEKTYLIFGSMAFLGMAILAITSNDWSVRKLGGKKWKSLHRIVYVVAIFVSLHVLWIEKADLIFFALFLIPLWLGQVARLIRSRI